MSRTICYLAADASSARLVGAAAGEPAASWRAENSVEGEPDARAIIARVGEAAAWCAERAPSGRIHLVCLGVDQASCERVAAPSAEPQVIAAVIRQRDVDWGASGVPASVQALVAPQTGGSPSLLHRLRARRKQPVGAAPTRRITVMRMLDGASRLWLDEMDRRAVRVGVVASLWHALCRAWGQDSPAATSPADAHAPVACIALLDGDGRIVWAWAEGRSLLTGGVAAVADPAPPAPQGEQPDHQPAPRAARDLGEACGRLALDWLTWSAQLGVRPDRLVVVGKGAGAFSARLATAWPSTPCEAIEDEDAVALTLSRLADDPRGFEGLADDPRACLLELSARPGKAHRRLVTWGATAAALLAVAAIGAGEATRRWAQSARDQAGVVRDSMQSDIEQVAPDARGSQFPVKALNAALARIEKDNPEVADPPPPRAVLDEVVRLAEQLQTLQGKQADIDRIQISADQATAIVRVKEFGPGEALRSALAASPGRIRWTGRMDGQPPNITLRLTGEWEAPR